MSSTNPSILPIKLRVLEELAYDLRWTGSQFLNAIWHDIDPTVWTRTQNPLLVLRNASPETLERLANDVLFTTRLEQWVTNHRRDESGRTWFDDQPSAGLRYVAYFSMEFMLAESLPIYSGGLGNVAGDQLKSASDLGVPVVGVGLLYQQGYFRQSLSVDGQLEALPFNDPSELPVLPVLDENGREVHVPLELPGRELIVRAWRARVGRLSLYLLDTNHPLNTPWDRGITANLYAAATDTRFLQEFVLGVAGWRLLESLGIPVDVCHLNEGHAAFATLARAASHAARARVSFEEALWTTRAGNVFTTHTPVDAAFDRFAVDSVLSYARPFVDALGISPRQLADLGRKQPGSDEPFNMAHLAMRGSGFVNGVSELHGRVSRRLFADLFPRWPLPEIPVQSVTNGVHVGTWDSAAANDLWRGATGVPRWTAELERGAKAVACLSEDAIWQFRSRSRLSLILEVRRRYAQQLAENGASPEQVAEAGRVLDPDVLTLGFARRFTAYKRPNLVLEDEERFCQLLRDTSRPVQFVIAGKAHPRDGMGKAMVRRMARFCARSDVSHRVVFLQDYDMGLAQVLTGGVDLWLNNPIRGNEASGTSGMKVLVNGGLNFSELDGWWDEAFAPHLGWALGGEGQEGTPDHARANQLYEILECEIVPEFYERDDHGVPRRWARRVRASMAELTPRFSSDRSVRQYTERAYIPAAQAFQQRTADEEAVGRGLAAWADRVQRAWAGVSVARIGEQVGQFAVRLDVRVSLGGLLPDDVSVELYAEPVVAGGAPTRVSAELAGSLPGFESTYLYVGSVPKDRPTVHFTPRVVPRAPSARIPLELCLIRWGEGE